MSSYEEVVSKDLELLWSIQEYCYRTPWLNDRMSKIISKNPLRDIVSILWIFFVMGLVELGPKHFWVVAMNMVVSFVARSLIEAKRPIEYDIRLQPLTDTRAESYGFPSLESYMSVVIMGHLFLSFKSLLLLPLGLAVIFVIGFSRVYSRSRFPHQIVGSWVCGLIGLLASMHCCEKMSFHTMSHHEHGVCVVFVLLGLVSNFALNVENNESRLVHLPREEFVKVMSDIISGGDKNTPSVVEESNDDEEFYDPMDPAGASWFQNSQRSTARSSARSASTKSSGKTAVEESPRTMATKQAQTRAWNGASMSDTLAIPSSANAPRGRRVKSDSLYFLQRSMEARENAYKSGVPVDTLDTSSATAGAQSNNYSGSV